MHGHHNIGQRTWLPQHFVAALSREGHEKPAIITPLACFILAYIQSAGFVHLSTMVMVVQVCFDWWPGIAIMDLLMPIWHLAGYV